MESKHVRIEFRDRIITLHKTIKNSILRYEEPADKMKAWKDLVLRDKKGKEIARVMTYGTFGNNDLRINL